MAYDLMVSELSDSELDVVAAGTLRPPPPPPSYNWNSHNNIIVTGPAINIALFNKGSQTANSGGNSIYVG